MTNSKPLEDHALFHKALAEPIRLRILARLNTRPSLCVCDLVDVLGLSQSTVSRHLAYLKNQKLVDSWREGSWVHYAIDKSHPAFKILQASLRSIENLELIQIDKRVLDNYEKIPRQCS